MASLQKYKMMLKIGLAEGAVRNKMKQEGFDDAKIDELFSSGQVVVPAPAPASAAAAQATGVPTAGPGRCDGTSSVWAGRADVLVMGPP